MDMNKHFWKEINKKLVSDEIIEIRTEGMIRQGMSTKGMCFPLKIQDLIKEYKKK